MKRVAIVGSGISGLGAAYALKDTTDITVFEATDRAGGHARTHTFDYDGTDVSVDLGFIVYNALNYPNLIALFEALNVKTQASDMSFSVSDPNGWEWASNARGLFAQKRNLFSPKFHRFWRTILKFNDIAREELTASEIIDDTLGGWLDRHGFPEDFRTNYILPMGAAIWSTPEQELLNYPALSFFRFFENHRLMHKERPKWRTVAGGSQNYVNAICKVLGPRLKLGHRVAAILPNGKRVSIRMQDGNQHIFDEVIIACHADDALGMVKQDYGDQATYLESIRYRPNSVFLHRDESLMPKRRAAWASWNVAKHDGEDVCLTYWMNLLQGIDASKPTFITLNPPRRPDPAKTFFEYQMDHPQFDAAAESAVQALKRIQGQNNLWFAGAWMGSGFHEDGLKSGLSAALTIGGKIPWTAEGIEIDCNNEVTLGEAVVAST